MFQANPNSEEQTRKKKSTDDGRTVSCSPTRHTVFAEREGSGHAATIELLPRNAIIELNS